MRKFNILISVLIIAFIISSCSSQEKLQRNNRSTSSEFSRYKDNNILEQRINSLNRLILNLKTEISTLSDSLKASKVAKADLDSIILRNSSIIGQSEDINNFISRLKNSMLPAITQNYDFANYSPNKNLFYQPQSNFQFDSSASLYESKCANFSVKTIKINENDDLGFNKIPNLFIKTFNDQLESLISALSTKFKIYARDDKIIEEVVENYMKENSPMFDKNKRGELAGLGINYLVLALVYNADHIRIKIIDTKSFEIVFSGITNKDLPAIKSFYPRLEIRSNALKDIVSINGIQYGPTPLYVNLAPGEYNISIRSKRYKTKTKKIKVNLFDKDKKISFKLNKR